MRANATAWTFTVTLSILLCSAGGAHSQAEGDADAVGEDQSAERRDPPGVFPALSLIFFLPPDIRLRYPDAPLPVEGDVEYNRLFPIFAKKALERGYALPRPVGVSILNVRNIGLQQITDLDLALGIDVIPPEGTELRSIPFVDVESITDTESPQLKVDLWVLPFLNIYGVYGRVDGRADLKVNVDLDAVTPVCRPNPLPRRPPICVGERLGGTRVLEFPTFVEAETFTLGMTGVYSEGNWFATGTINGTLTVSAKDKSDVRSWGASARVGRRWVFGRGNIFAPFAGLSYTDVDTRIQGTATLEDAFPDGKDLSTRFDVKLDNEDKLQNIFGFNLGFNNGISLSAEYNWANSGVSDRVVVALEARF